MTSYVRFDRLGDLDLGHELGEDSRIALLDIDTSGVEELAGELGAGALAVQVDLSQDESLVR
ncbi:hypothetical protein E1267_02250 [Nonomuraea longispora]|uniref:Uncharacterized protein n=1 Tax=Nonomuraea longispora TaxID=1848320 RepID=A0A4R4NNF3_9ACTN|nr:hypothetical protein [Nonomuraea longispora]TDC11031.1 hypothetical protein E1267_02250 [Nonomuraea longispora]